MLTQLKIPQKKNQPLAMNRQQLYQMGLNYVQKLSSRIWTDYNIHDPGITTLELLCYALTDLSYRATLPMEDLLASKANNAEEMKKQFFTARQILPNRPLTLLDYRKLLIDINGVKNAWLNQAQQRYYADTIKGELLRQDPKRIGIVAIDLAGLYDVKIEYEDDITTAADQQQVIEAVRQKLQVNRNLCEDFVQITEVETQSFQLCAELELMPDADVTQVNMAILSQVQQYLSPPIKFYLLSELLVRKKPDGTSYSVDEIFDGPALDHGFIDDQELQEANLRTEIRLSDLISIIMDIPGVQAVRDIVINPTSNPTETPVPLVNKWIISVESGKQAQLNIKKSRLVYYKRNMPVVPAPIIASPTTVLPSPLEANDLPIPLGTYRELATYHSFQNHFPVIYGLSEVGLKSPVGRKRQALAYQLKAYLLFFDQIMANYLAQLSQVKDLFSINPDLQQTYFYQIVDSFVDYEKIYATNNVIETLKTQNKNQEKASGFTRRNHFLDHLIARFAERFHDYVYTLQSRFGSSPETVIRSKCEFLKNYPTISCDRALAYNYSLTDPVDLWNLNNVSGLEKRLIKLLGIVGDRRQNLTPIDYEIIAETTSAFRFQIKNKETDESILISTQAYPNELAAREAMKIAIHFGQYPEQYQKKQINLQHEFRIVDENEQEIAKSFNIFETKAQRNKALEAVILLLNRDGEGMYLIENLLLRTELPSDDFLPICPNPSCVDCAEIDPYSYRIHIVLPGYGSRFGEIDFRRFAEDLIRKETPAHLLPKICWISKEDMTVFEKLYRNWIELKAGVDTTQRQAKLKDFIQQLFAIKNVYPPQKLHDCDSAEDQPKFILGQTALGTGRKSKP